MPFALELFALYHLLDGFTRNGGRKQNYLRFATRVMADACREVVSAAGMTMDDIDFIVPHQANVRIIEAAARNLNLPLDMFVMNMERYGNTSAASIPLALCEAVMDNRIKPYNNLVFVAFGGGLTWGATLVTWDVAKSTLPNQVLLKLRRQALYGVARIRSAIRRGTRTIEGALWGGEEMDSN